MEDIILSYQNQEHLHTADCAEDLTEYIELQI